MLRAFACNSLRWHSKKQTYRALNPHSITNRHYSNDVNKASNSTEKKPPGRLKRWWKIAKDVTVHYWHGTKSFAHNLRVSTRLLAKQVKGAKLSRREYKLLVTTSGDIVRLVPFLFFVIVPFAEFALPFFLKMFPNMLPSTFATADQNESNHQRLFKARVGFARFVIDTVKEKNEKEPFTKDFETFLDSIRSADNVSKDQLFKFVSKFKDDITLDNLKRNQLQAMCRFLDIRPYGPTEFLRYMLTYHIQKLKRDDHMIDEEGIESLTLLELKQACAARGMNSMGTRKVLEGLMEEWLDLSLNLKVPTAMLILSRAFRFASSQSNDELLKESIAHLPPEVIKAVDTTIEEKKESAKEDKQDMLKEQIVPKVSTQEKVELVGSVEQSEQASKMLDKVEALSDAISESVAPDNYQKEILEDIQRDLKDIKSDVKIEAKLSKMVKTLEEDYQKTRSQSKKLLDLDNDGLLTCAELADFLKKKLNFTDSDVKIFLERLDTDEDGYIAVENLINLRDLVVNEDAIKELILYSNVNKDKPTQND